MRGYVERADALVYTILNLSPYASVFLARDCGACTSTRGKLTACIAGANRAHNFFPFIF